TRNIVPASTVRTRPSNSMCCSMQLNSIQPASRRRVQGQARGPNADTKKCGIRADEPRTVKSTGQLVAIAAFAATASAAATTTAVSTTATAAATAAEGALFTGTC